jgi:hypothetical protein
MKEKSNGKFPRQVKVYQPNDHDLPPEDVEHIDSLAHRWSAAQTSDISDAHKIGIYNPSVIIAKTSRSISFKHFDCANSVALRIN